MENGLARGVRQASDFLMALQLTGAAKHDSVANLTVRLPIVVIGGGLTAIDTATEALAYYPVQVEKFFARRERLEAAVGNDVVQWDDDEAAIAAEFVAHARALRDERATAAKEGRLPRIAALLESWGGATVVYRRKLIESPSYTLNHEEVEKAMQEGIAFAENLAPEAVEARWQWACGGREVQRNGSAGRTRHGDACGPDRPGGGRHAAQYRARPRGPDQCTARREAFSGFRRDWACGLA